MLLDILVGQPANVQDDSVVALAETDGHRQMHLWRLELTDLMDAERRLVGHDPSITSP